MKLRNSLICREQKSFCQPSPKFLFLPVAQSTGCCRMQGILETRSGGQGVVWASHKSPIPPNGTPPCPHPPHSGPCGLLTLSVSGVIYGNRRFPLLKRQPPQPPQPSARLRPHIAARAFPSNGPDTSPLTGPLAERLRAGREMR